MKMAGVHESNAKALGSRFQHQGARIIIIDRCRFQIGQTDHFLPCIKAARHFPVNENRHIGDLFGRGDGIRAVHQIARSDQVDFVMIQLMGIECWVDILRKDDGGVLPFAQTRNAVRRGLYVEVQIGMQLP